MKFGRQVAPSDVVNYFALVLSEAMPFGGCASPAGAEAAA